MYGPLSLESVFNRAQIQLTSTFGLDDSSNNALIEAMEF